MHWKKRKKLRKIAKHAGYTHYYEYKRNLKWIVQAARFHDALRKLVAEMCDRTRKERLGYVDYLGIYRNGLFPTPEDLKNEQTQEEKAP